MSPSEYTPSTLQHYLEILRKHKKVAIVAVVIVPLVALAYSFLQVPSYQSSSEVLLGRQNLAASLTGVQDPSGYELSDRPIQTQADLARVPEVVQRTLAAAGRTEMSIPAFLAASSVTSRSNSDILDFRVTHTEPWVAEQLATAYARQFTRYRLELDTAPAKLARAQLQRRISQLRKSGQAGGELYSNLVDSEQRLATFQALQTSNAYVVRTAAGAIQVAPTTKRNVMLAVGMGILLAIALVAIAHALDSRGRAVRSLEDTLGVRLLARIPAPPTGNGALVMRSDPTGIHAESYRVLRANLEFVNRGHEAKVIMVTSALEGEGKSTTLANLAIAFAREGKRIVLADLDLRRPTIATLFNVPPEPGIVDAAFGRTSLERALRTIQGSNGQQPTLHVIPAGLPTQNVGEFTASEQLRSLLDKLRSQADVVLIDAPPLLASSDAVTLGSVVDGIVLVTGQDSLRWQTLDDVMRTLSMCAAPTLGWVLTGTESLVGYGYYTPANVRD